MKSLRTMWSSTDFGANELTRYASAVMCREARQGIFVLGILTMLLMAGLALLYHALGLGAAYSYTFGVLALLALHVAVSKFARIGSGWISLARATSLLVSPLISETTTTSRCPAALNAAILPATLLMRSVVPTEVQPNFWTIIPASKKALNFIANSSQR